MEKYHALIVRIREKHTIASGVFAKLRLLHSTLQFFLAGTDLCYAHGSLIFFKSHLKAFPTLYMYNVVTSLDKKMATEDLSFTDIHLIKCIFFFIA